MQQKYDVIFAGGGLAGLVGAILLRKKGYDVCIIEKQQYPFHRVCGEYISNEVKPFLEQEGLFPHELIPSQIHQLILTHRSQKMVSRLDMGAFGISRYALDLHLSEKAKAMGVDIVSGMQIEQILQSNALFEVKTADNKVYSAHLCIGSFGKRSVLDRFWQRKFFTDKSPYIAVKYHIRGHFPKDSIHLHLFKDGYCGMSAVENDLYCLCYLTTRNALKKAGSIEALEQQELFKNPALKNIFETAEFVWEKPLVINEISFAPKTHIENGVIMVGDAAGMITPLCGNGMAMAIHSAKILSECFPDKNKTDNSLKPENIYKHYNRQWKREFSLRLTIGRWIQNLFGHPILTGMVLSILKHIPFLKKKIISLTHGKYIT